MERMEYRYRPQHALPRKGTTFGRTLLVVLTLLLAPCGHLWAQESEVQQGLMRGNARQVAQYFEPSVELKLLGTVWNVPASEAEQHLDEFFSQHPPSNFKFEHQRSRNRITYLIGTLTAGQDRYRVSILFLGQDSDMRIHGIQIANCDI